MTVQLFNDVFGKTEGLYKLDIESIKSFCLKEAEKSERKRCLLLVQSGSLETGHRFFNALLPGTQLSVHRHMSKYQTETYVPLHGDALVVSFTNEGEIANCLIIGETNGFDMVEIKPETWHTIIPLTPFVMYEIKGQPENYDPENDKEFAPWAPKEGEDKFDAYIESIKDSALKQIANNNNRLHGS